MGRSALSCVTDAPHLPLSTESKSNGQHQLQPDSQSAMLLLALRT